jgi:superfamily II DNA/RNA helicase
LDNILNGILSRHQYRLLNANDFTTLCKKFNSKIATNVMEAIDYLIKDINEIIETEKIHIESLEKLIIDDNNIEEYYQKKKDELNKKIEEIKKSVEESYEEESYEEESNEKESKKDNNENKKVNIEELENIINQRKTVEYNLLEQEEYKKELVIRKKSLEYNTERINLIKERLIENNCCPTCYEELGETDIKTVSPCCKNMVCHKCVNQWYNVNKKTNCIYCNKADIKYDDFVIIKNVNSENEVKCLVCNTDLSLFIDNNDNLEDITLYAECCKKICCKKCLNIWYKTLYKKECLICHKDDILLDDFKNKKQHDEMLDNIKNGYKYIKKSKIQFLEYFISTKIINNPSLKLIIFSDYINSFIEIKQLFNKSNILYTEFDGGNISQIENQLLEFKNGNVQVLMCNSLLFGCGMNLEFGTDIIFFHKMTDCMKKQVIGRCQRPGRKTRLNIWYLMHENENEYNIIREDTINDDDFIYSNKGDESEKKLSVNDIINSYDFNYDFDDNDENKNYTII